MLIEKDIDISISAGPGVGAELQSPVRLSSRSVVFLFVSVCFSDQKQNTISFRKYLLRSAQVAPRPARRL